MLIRRQNTHTDKIQRLHYFQSYLFIQLSVQFKYTQYWTDYKITSVHAHVCNTLTVTTARPQFLTNHHQIWNMGSQISFCTNCAFYNSNESMCSNCWTSAVTKCSLLSNRYNFSPIFTNSSTLIAEIISKAEFICDRKQKYLVHVKHGVCPILQSQTLATKLPCFLRQKHHFTSKNNIFSTTFTIFGNQHNSTFICRAFFSKPEID